MYAETPLNKIRRGVAVTTIANQFWCEKAVELAFTHKTPETEEMRKGKERHDVLHKEIAELLPVTVTSIEDRIGVMYHNAMVGMVSLIKKNKTREIPVVGWLSALDIPVFGKIDELVVRNNETRIIDHKTRRGETKPSPAQVRVTEFQVMAYYQLLSAVKSNSFNILEVLKFYNLDHASTFSASFLNQLDNRSRPIETNLSKLGAVVMKAFEKIPELSKELEIIYEAQETGKIIGTHRFAFNNEKWTRDLEFALDYWLGKRAAIPVGEKNRWKCNFCSFKSESICPIWARN